PAKPPMTANGIYQMIVRRGQQCGVDAWPHRFRHHFSHTWLDRGGPEGDLMELNGWTSPQMLRCYRASPPSARPRRTYDPAPRPAAPTTASWETSHDHDTGMTRLLGACLEGFGDPPGGRGRHSENAE